MVLADQQPKQHVQSPVRTGSKSVSQTVNGPRRAYGGLERLSQPMPKEFLRIKNHIIDRETIKRISLDRSEIVITRNDGSPNLRCEYRKCEDAFEAFEKLCEILTPSLMVDLKKVKLV